MPKTGACETLWISDPAALIGGKVAVYQKCDSNNINAFTRAVLIGFIVGGILSYFVGVSISVIFVIIALGVLYGRWILEKASGGSGTGRQEGFTNWASIIPGAKEPPAFPQIMSSPGATVTAPKPGNPFMNVLIDELKYNPTRPPAEYASDPNNKVILDDFFRVQWTSDPTDVFGRTQSQRQFYTMPSTSIPNDQGSFQNWLYLIPGKTCKEGGRDACYPGTNGAPIPWLSQPN
jgi:hypothetical protein